MKNLYRFEAKWLIGILMALFLAFGLGQMATAEELGDIPLDPETYQRYLKTYPDELREALPAAYDARNEGIVTSPKNQGACGSCWAFASVGAMESHLLKKWGYGPTDLSEQQLLSCNPYGYTCAGGSSTAIRYWETTGPIPETCFPYTAMDTTPCSYSCDEMVTRVTGWHTVSQTTADFKTSCYNEGPSYWRFDVYRDFSYSGTGFWNEAGPGDVYVNSGGIKRGGHAVLIIGWDDSKGAFLCKNSWGATAGPNGDGTFWIAYSGHYYNLGFGMANFDLINEPGEWDYCFDPSTSSAIYEFNKEGMWLIGETRGGSCGEGNPIMGWVYEGNWVLARDIPSAEPCLESMFYWGNVGPTKNYDWINSAGTTGTGTLYPCGTMEGGITGDDALGVGKDTSEGGTYCLVDDWGNQYNLTTSGMYIEGTVNHLSCGTCPLIGMVKGDLFSFYVDIPSGTGCAEGYVVAAKKETKNGKYHNIGPGTGSIHFTPCAATTELEPTLGLEPGPGEK